MKHTNAWLVTQGRVLASATVADSRKERRRGLIGESNPEFAMVLPKCNWVHTFGVKCALDVAYLDEESFVVKIQRLAPMRLPLPVREAKMVVEAKAGSFERWGLNVGDVVEVRRA
jgi:uncharacterized membrane protein (UPF0127 family)